MGDVVEQLRKLDNLLDIIISNTDVPKENDSHSIKALLEKVLITYVDQKLDQNEELLAEGLKESSLVSKMLDTLKSIFERHPSLIVDENRYITILKYFFSFFNSINCPTELINHAIFNLMEICSSTFRTSYLRYNKFIYAQRDYTLNYVTKLLSEIIKTFTNTNNTQLSLEQNDDYINKLPTTEEYNESKLDKISKVSVCVKILQFLVHPSISKIFFTRYQSSYILDSIISRCWFCLNNININIKFVPENQKIIEIMDDLCSSLLITTCKYFTHDTTYQTNRMMLVIFSCKKLLSSPLLSKFSTLQVVLAQCLLDLAINLSGKGNINFFWQNIGITGSPADSFADLTTTVNHPELLNCIQLLVNAKLSDSSNSKDLQFVKPVSQFQTFELQSLRSRFESCFFAKEEITCVTRLNQDTLQKFDTTLNQMIDSSPETTEIEIINKINLLGDYLCHLMHNYDISSNSCEVCDKNLSISISIKDIIDINRPNLTAHLKAKSVYDVLNSLYTKYTTTTSVNISIALLITTSKLLKNFRIPSLKNENRLWLFLKSCFENPVREVRLLCVQVFPLIIYTPDDLQNTQDFAFIVSYLIHFVPKVSNNYVFEGVIMTLGNLLTVRAVDRNSFSILDKLIKFMADSDEMRSVLALNQLRMIANSKNVTPWQIIEPFLPWLSYNLVKKQNQMLLTNICLALELSPSLFVKRTIKYTLARIIDEPVNTYNMEHICSLTHSNAPELMHDLLENIIAYLMVHGDNSAPDRIVRVLGFYDAQYTKMRFPDLLKKCKQPVVIFQLLFQSQNDNIDKIVDALRLMSQNWGYEGNPEETTQKLLNESMLVVIQMISTILNDRKGNNPYALKLKALDAIVSLQKVYNQFDAYLGHITNTLQTALQINELKGNTLLCIKQILDAVNPRNFSLIFDSVVSQLLVELDKLSQKNQIIAHSIIRKLSLNDSNSVLPLKPSYKFGIEKKIDINFDYKQFHDDKPLVKSFLARFDIDNKWVTLQALNDFHKYLSKLQSERLGLVESDIKLAFAAIVKLLVSKEAVYMGEQNDLDLEISHKSANVISIVGNLDFMSTQISRKAHVYDNVSTFLLVTNLQKQKSSDVGNGSETFSIHFLENVLVKSFIAAVDPDDQKRLAFAIQEYLILCNFSPQIWDSFDDLTRNVLEPLRTSKYGYRIKSPNINFPIFDINKDYATWLVECVAAVLKSCAALAHEVFNAPPQVQVLCSLIPTLDLAVSKFVFPYAVLMLIVTGTENIKSDFHKEILTILNNDLKVVPNEILKETLEKCMVTIFEIIQFLKAWVNQMKDEEEAKTFSKSSSKFKKTGIARVEKFLKSIPTKTLSERYMQCNMYEGSILYLEQAYKENYIERDVLFSGLKDMYVQLEDFDQLHGALKTFSTNSLNDKLLQFKYNEDPQISNESMNAIAQYDFDFVEDQPDVAFNDKRSSIELFEVLNRNCEYDQILLSLKNFENKLKCKDRSINSEWIFHGIQASIFTGDINELRKWTALSQGLSNIAVAGSDLSIYYEIAEGLIKLHEGDVPKSHECIECAIKYIGLAISHSDHNIHRKLPDYVALLHSLYDFKTLIKMDISDTRTTKLIENRLSNSKREFRSLWKIHSLKSSVLKLHKGEQFQELYKDSLIEGCKILRENKKLPQATKIITKALVLNGNDSKNEMKKSSTLLMNMEFSKLFWSQGDYETALKNMSLVVDSLEKSDKSFHEANLTYLNWLDISAEGSSDQILQHYRDLLSTRSLKESFKVEYQYANYINKLLDAQSFDEADGSLDFKAVQYYLKTAVHNEFVYETLPKAITLLLGFHEKYLAHSDKRDSKLISKRLGNYQFMKKAAEKSVTFLGQKWYIVLSQLISRTTHEDKEIQKIIKDILITLATDYYPILMYPIFAQSRSIDKERRKVGSEVIQKLQSINQESLSKQIASCLQLLEAIMAVCNTKEKLTRGSSTSRDLYKDLGFNYPRGTPNMALCLPIKYNVDLLYNLSSSAKQKLVCYQSFHEKVRVLSSMQQPKRIKVTGTNGASYYLLFKPNDDLRKDNKVMEFATIMNRLLQKNFETQQRNLCIKGFAATPLNETTGIIEWVQHFITLRPILEKQLRRNNIVFKASTLKSLMGEASESEKLSVFESLLDKYPPVLAQSMIDSSPNVIEWYKNRKTYTTSLAVMSIVGYLMGVGDRHLDNIMMNRQTGMIMHIDFDCIFEKGKTLNVPEIVPFRLTPNLVDAMGALGYEGLFRKSCELIMALMRDNENILMNFLESFIHDPLMDWKMKSNSRVSRKFQKDHVYKTLRNKIKGILVKDDDNTGCKDSGGLSVSVSLQVELLLQTATSHENLSKMFYGWMPYL
ncbi:hypothetical protein CANINC_004135 [Pichia inconspicua]|uniref:non-specific serine/threonine protein kinase n=1 Tax=Pichia inconspicua TaxID=52247 RepID=A0A4T0WWY1_9ASCO|nr:hypothetical protein CANINC_004135 [[Candida] inconspicua]